MSIRTHFEEDLAALNREILKMGLLAETAILKAMASVRENRPELAQAVIEEDILIDKMEDSLCDRCSLILAREQPVAGILRHLVSVLRIIPELERIGDHAVHIAQRHSELCGTDMNRFHPSLFEMTNVAVGMLREALNAFVEEDINLARETAGRDQQINTLHKALYTEAITGIKDNDILLEDGVAFLFTSRYLERLGDHIKNICEWVVFSSTGEFVDF